jgi:hypothetical protein
MPPGAPMRVIAACVALGAFVIALIAGLWAGNALDSIIERGLVAMAAGGAVGLCVGAIAERAVMMQIERQRASAALASSAAGHGATGSRGAGPSEGGAESDALKARR